MISTLGLTHVAIEVADLERSRRFYETLLGMRVLYRDGSTLELGTPGRHDVLTLMLSPGKAQAGSTGVLHFGFRLPSPRSIDGVAEAVAAAGGSVEAQGEFVPGEPYVKARDPDGYLVELWFEPLAPRPTD